MKIIKSTDLLKDPKWQRALNKYDLPFHVGQMIINLRIRKGLTQEKLAKKIGTKQSVIARLEGSRSLPSMVMLDRIAKACNVRIRIDFDAAKNPNQKV